MWRRLFPHHHFHLPLVLLPHAISFQTRTFNANCNVFGFKFTSCTHSLRALHSRLSGTHRTPNRIPFNNNNKDLKWNEKKKRIEIFDEWEFDWQALPNATISRLPHILSFFRFGRLCAYRNGVSSTLVANGTQHKRIGCTHTHTHRRRLLWFEFIQCLRSIRFKLFRLKPKERRNYRKFKIRT